MKILKVFDWKQFKSYPIFARNQLDRQRESVVFLLNLWHLSHEGLDLEDAGNEPQYEKKGFLEMGVSPIDAPDTPTYITLDFEAGVPVALDGVKMSAKDIILKLNELGGANGIGLLDIVENRLVGMKCRGVYETPGGTYPGLCAY